jgi:hypothetical protein
MLHKLNLAEIAVRIIVSSAIFGSVAGCPPDDMSPMPDPNGPKIIVPMDPQPEAKGKTPPLSNSNQDVGWLLEHSSLVFIGFLADQAIERDALKLIVTHNEFIVEEVVLGAFDEETLTLTTLGGTFGQETLRVSHMPEFELFGRYLIFTDPTRTTYDPVTGNEKGVFVISDDNEMFTIDGIGVTGVNDGIVQTSDLTLVDDPDAPERLSVKPVFDGNILAIEPVKPDLRKPIHVKEFIKTLIDMSRSHGLNGPNLSR